MLRKLLTLLAIVTGLAATGAPAHARMAVSADVTQEASSGTVAACQATTRQLAEKRRQPGGTSKADREKFCPIPSFRVLTPTVMLGADRARE